MRRFHLANGLALMLALAAVGSLRADDKDKPKAKPEYETRQEHDPNGIGKFYLGREIAMVMGHEAAGWLDRPEREKEEAPQQVIDVLKLRQGDVVADVGAGSGYFSFRLAKA